MNEYAAWTAAAASRQRVGCLSRSRCRRPLRPSTQGPPHLRRRPVLLCDLGENVLYLSSFFPSVDNDVWVVLTFACSIMIIFIL